MDIYGTVIHELAHASHWDMDKSGYTIRQIEDALIGQKTWNGWRNNIIRMYNNETEHNLPTLFEYWRTH